MTAVPQPTQSLEILVAPRDSGGVQITVNGELDTFSINYVVIQINAVLHQSAPTAIDLNLGGVEFIDAGAVERLCRLHRLAADAGCVLSIGPTTQYAWWPSACTGLDSIYPVRRKYRRAS